MPSPKIAWGIYRLAVRASAESGAASTLPLGQLVVQPYSGFRISVWQDWTRKRSPCRYLPSPRPLPEGEGE